jgi:type I restriction enzyme R subunit/putative DNA methylase
MNCQTKREYLRQLVDGKNEGFRSLRDEERALGFLGWHERGHLPHCDYPGLVQLVTFRLADSLPESRRGEWEHLLAIEDVREKRSKLEEYLDRGAGECHLREPRIARLCEDALLFFHKARYELLAWCVMPNHVHVLVHVWRTPLGRMVQSWKRHIATQAEVYLAERRSPTRQWSLASDGAIGRRPALRSTDGRGAAANGNEPARRAALRRQTLQWQREYWDTFMRDERQERKAIHYIEANPLKARLCRAPGEWPFSSARFREPYQRLVIPDGKESHVRKASQPGGAPVSDPAVAFGQR